MRQAGNDGDNRPVMLGVAGDSAAGKTTLTRGLVAAMGGEGISSFCVDDYHRYDRQERKGLPFTPLNPACNYVGIMEQHLQLVAMGQPILKPVYNHHDGTLERPVLFEPGEYVIVEGLLPLHNRLSRACFDLTVYLDPPEDIRHAWKIKRDTRDRGYSRNKSSRIWSAVSRIRPPTSALSASGRTSWSALLPSRVARSPTAFSRRRSCYAQPRPIRTSTPFSPRTRERPSILKLARDIDGRPVDALHVHAYASREAHPARGGGDLEQPRFERRRARVARGRSSPACAVNRSPSCSSCSSTTCGSHNG